MSAILVGFDGSRTQYRENLLPWLEQMLSQTTEKTSIGLELAHQTSPSDFQHINTIHGEIYFKSLKSVIQKKGHKWVGVDSLAARERLNLTHQAMNALQNGRLPRVFPDDPSAKEYLQNLKRRKDALARATPAERAQIAANNQIIDYYLRPLFIANRILRHDTAIAILTPETALAVGRLLKKNGVVFRQKWFGKPRLYKRWKINRRTAHAQIARMNAILQRQKKTNARRTQTRPKTERVIRHA